MEENIKNYKLMLVPEVFFRPACGKAMSRGKES